MQQTEIKIVVYNPTLDVSNFTADVYVDGRRVHCGKGGQTYPEALKEAMEWTETTMIHNYLKQREDIGKSYPTSDDRPPYKE